MSNKIKRDSRLVKSVLALDNYLTELERIGTKINSTDMTSDFDVDYIQKLVTRFAECGQGVSEELSNLSTQLHEARTRAEAVAQGVSAQAELLNQRRNEQNEKLEKFRVLGEKVRELTAAISQFRPPHGHGLTDEDRAKLTSNIPAFEAQLVLLIEELQDLRKSARNSRMKALEKNAESLAQTLQAVRKKLGDLGPSTTGGSGAPN
jgi:chromosome segregation ATPase